MRYSVAGLLACALTVASPWAQAQALLADRLVAGDALERYWTDSLSGGPPRDGIPSIDQPRFESVEAADRWLKDDDRIIGLYLDGVARAYPQRILVWHELVNDKVAGEGVAISYCPLTGTSLGFKRGDNELGVSGRLINSNLIMYDRDTDSYWPQILGTAIEGRLMNRSLEQLPLIWTSWGEWKQRYETSEVLSRRTGYSRNFRRDPYGGYGPKSGYYAKGEPMFPVFHRSDRYPAKHEIYGFRSANEAVAVDLSDLAAAGHLTYRGVDGDYLILWDQGLNTAWAYRADDELPETLNLDDLHFGPAGATGQAIEGLTPVPGFAAMWFAWFAFYPETHVLDVAH